jgi:hypothetical protein
MSLNLKLIMLPDAPHLTKNRLYAYLYALGREKEHPYISNFITFDFETCKNISSRKDITDKMICEATLHSISVAWTTVLGNQINTGSMFIENHSQVDFINKF